MSVFVQVVSYRDPDLLETVKNCISKSSDKDGLHFGILLQQDEPAPKELNHPRVRVETVPHLESPGPGWARSRTQGMYDGQDYVLQVDSGSRFADGWDKKLIDALSALPSEKPLITNCANKYAAGVLEQPEFAYKTQHYQFLDETPLSWAAPMKGIKNPVRARSLSEHFVFSRGSHCLECPYDPEMYFSELEASLTLRSFTLGYDIFNYHLPMVWRNYSRKMNWEDDTGWWAKYHLGKSRFSLLLSGQAGRYGLGSFRTLRDYELFSGVDFKGRRLQKDCLAGVEPPGRYENDAQWESSYTKDYSITVSWNPDEIERCDDYDYWYFAVEDDSGNTISRQDLRTDRDAELLNFKKSFKKIFFRSLDNRIPKHLCVWPLSKSKGWLKKSKFEIQGVKI